MSKLRRVAVLTGTRAEYGLLRWLIKDLRCDPRVDCQLIVTGSHLSPRHGDTVAEIEAEGHRIDAEVEILLSSDSGVGVAKAMGLGAIGFADAFARLRPDILVVLGDRFEILAAAQAALAMRIPIAHIHGGESTEGAWDDAIRHAVTKMAHLHFAAALPYARRLLQMGEQRERVHTVGAPGLDTLGRCRLLRAETLERDLGLSLRKPTYAVTWHPLTLGSDATQGLNEILAALDLAMAEFGAQCVVTGTNADAGGEEVRQRINAWASERGPLVHQFESLGQPRFLSLLAHSAASVGNSSSGLLEAPALKTPTVNIGARQEGRLAAESVISVPAVAGEILEGLRQAQDAGWLAEAFLSPHPYGGPGASRKIAETLIEVSLEGILTKRFVDQEIDAQRLAQCTIPES